VASSAAAIAAAAGAAVCFGVASAAQHVAAGQVDRRGALDPGLLATLARRPVWVASWLGDVLAVVLQAMALRWGSVPLVQAVVVAGLPVAVLLRTRAAPAGRELAGLALTCAGIVAVVVALPTTDPGRAVPHPSRALAAGVAVVLAVGLLVRAGHTAARRGRPALDGLCVGTAAGVCVGAAAVPLALAVRRLPDLPAVLGSWPVWLALAAGASGLLLSQAAFQRGAIAAPLAALTLAEPVAATVLAAALLRVPLASGRLGTLLVTAGAVAAAGGVALLAPAAADGTGPDA
jgi:hypothetical protein